jgi:hypothetical protein
MLGPRPAERRAPAGRAARPRPARAFLSTPHRRLPIDTWHKGDRGSAFGLTRPTPSSRVKDRRWTSDNLGHPPSRASSTTSSATVPSSGAPKSKRSRSAREQLVRPPHRWHTCLHRRRPTCSRRLPPRRLRARHHRRHRLSCTKALPRPVRETTRRRRRMASTHSIGVGSPLLRRIGRPDPERRTNHPDRSDRTRRRRRSRLSSPSNSPPEEDAAPSWSGWQQR